MLSSASKRVDISNELEKMSLETSDSLSSSASSTPIKQRRYRKLSSDLISTPKRYKLLKKRASVVLFVGRGGWLSDGDSPNTVHKKRRKKSKKDRPICELSLLLSHLDVK